MDCRWIPRPLARLLRPLRETFSKPRWRNFVTLVMGTLLTQRISTLSAIAQATTRQKNRRTSLGRFLVAKGLDTADLLQRLFSAVLLTLVVLLGDEAERRIYLIIDSTIRERASLKVEGSQFVKLPSGGYGPGHIVLVVAIRVGPFTLPLRIEPILSKHWAKVLNRPHRTQIQVCEEAIREFQPPSGWEVCVLFDSFFGANKVLRACEERGFVFVTNLKSNRKVRAHRRTSQVGRYAKNVLSHNLTATKVGRSTFLTACRDSALPGVGRVRLVFSRKPGHSRIYHLATNATTTSPAEIVRLYLLRWSIECLFKDVKHHLGMGDYPARTLDGAANHLRLVFIAHLLLTFQRSKQLEPGKTDMQNASSPSDIRTDLRTRHQAYHLQRTLRARKLPANIDQIERLLRLSA